MSKKPNLEQMLKLWSKKDLWNRIQEKNKQIIDLEAKLAEKDLRIEELESQFTYECECNKQFVDCQKENARLKQQLAEKDAEIKKYKLEEFADACADLGMPKLSKHQLWQSLGEQHTRNMVLEKQLGQANQDKISFAVEQLEKVKENLLENLYDLYSKPSEIWDKYGDLYDVVVEGGINGTIDNQIKQLKEGK